jgi:hypothetical protein
MFAPEVRLEWCVDDLFYFSPMETSVSDLAAFLESRGYRVEGVNESGAVVRFGEGIREKSHWAPFDISEWPPEELEEVRRRRGVRAFCVSHHRAAIRALLPMLREVLLRFGGFVGNDSVGFGPFFDSSSVDSFRYADDDEG